MGDGAFLSAFNDIVVRTHLNNLAGGLPTDWYGQLRAAVALPEELKGVLFARNAL
jgi:hypothetical protein